MRISRRLAATIALSLIATLLTTFPARANIPANFIFTGSGYGHGVGMSQIGARGMALESATATDILTHFYPGAVVAPVVDTQIIRVNIGHRQREATITLRPLDPKASVPTSLTLLKDRLAPGAPAQDSQVVGTYLTDISLNLTSLTNSIEVTRSSKTAKFAPLDPSRQWTIRWDSQSVLSVRTQERTYLIRYGQVNVARVKNDLGLGQMEITASMRLGDEYLFGLGEVPSSWPAASLEAQAIAARTFALTKMRSIRSACDCNIYSTTRDQNYVGFSKESEAIYGIRWRSAVERTLGIGVLFDGKPIQAFYFSSSGGMTQNVKDVWGSEFPYLVSRPDTWSVSTALNPRYASWRRTITQEAMAKAFQIQDVDRYQILSRTPTGSIARIRAVSSLGAESILTGETFRSRVGLPSTWINLPKPVEDQSEDGEVADPVEISLCLRNFLTYGGIALGCEVELESS